MNARFRFEDASGRPLGVLTVDRDAFLSELEESYRESNPLFFPEDFLHQFDDCPLLQAWVDLRDSNEELEFQVVQDGCPNLLAARLHDRLARLEFLSYECLSCRHQFRPDEIVSEYWREYRRDGRRYACPHGHVFAKSDEIVCADRWELF